ncbi:MAG TPA: reverse transcriptase domain-containing protein [Streptosporangiaceae bacterium]|jgi:RNA-directed DNA polymerase|nr:reverse transcriptase domain-containing protein [Streptosporangiaceae bacterium]
MKFLRHRIADERVLRLIGRWLAAGVIEDGAWTASEQGSPQGASVSPLLANVYLHYVLDLWADWWRKRFARGDVIIVRFADDFIVGFEEREDAERFLAEMRERFAKFSLELHPGKTRLIEFGRHAARRRAARGEGKPETFAFLGFTHICATSRRGRFWVRRKTDSKRMRAKLKMVKDQLRRRRYQPIPEQGRWLAAVVRGHQAYYAVPGNNRAVNAFRTQAARHWHHALQRRSQKSQLPWTRMNRIVTRWLPPTRTLHPFPEVRFAARLPKARAQCGSPARWDLRGGPPARAVPTATLLSPVGCQNCAGNCDLGLQAARSYSLRRPPRTGRRLICSWERSATGCLDRGGWSWSPQCGLRPL